MKIELLEYDVIKLTPKGVRVDDYSENGRIVLHDSKKKFCCKTKKEAFENFEFRKKRQLSILTSQRDYVLSVLDLIKKERKERIICEDRA